MVTALVTERKSAGHGVAFLWRCKFGSRWW
jgi:hypothetical protein